MYRSFNDYSLQDIPKEFLRNHNNSNYKNTNDINIASTNEVFTNKSNNQNSFDNIWILLIILIIFDLV